MRYECEDEDTDETRREKNERLNLHTPVFIIPERGKYLWDWFHELNRAVPRFYEGYCRRIPPSEYLAWCKMTRNIVYPLEYDILMAMDAIYCEETNKEITNKRSIEEDKRQRDMEKKR